MLQSFLLQSPSANELYFLLSVRAGGTFPLVHSGTSPGERGAAGAGGWPWTPLQGPHSHCPHPSRLKGQGRVCQSQQGDLREHYGQLWGANWVTSDSAGQDTEPQASRGALRCRGRAPHQNKKELSGTTWCDRVWWLGPVDGLEGPYKGGCGAS